MAGDPPTRFATLPFGIDWSTKRREPAPAMKVGIVMRTRDRPLLLPRAIASVTAQTLDDWHLVVVNHGGKPEPVEQAIADADPAPCGRIEVVHLDDGGGMERASNAGLERLDAEYVAVHDDDDTWLPTFLERTVEFLDDGAHQRFGAVVTHIVQRWERIDGEVIEHVIDNDLNGDDLHVDVQRLFGWNRFLPIGMLVRAAVFDVVGPFNERLEVIGDWEFNLRLAAVTDIGLIPEPLARYHLRAEGGAGSDLAYGNTITASVKRHLETDASVRAALLRRYLDADPSRLGLLVALSHDDEMARRLNERVRDVVEQIDWRTHHTGNRVNDAHDRVMAMERELPELRRQVAETHVMVARLHRALATLARPIRPLRVVRERWRLRQR